MGWDHRRKRLLDEPDLGGGKVEEAIDELVDLLLAGGKGFFVPSGRKLLRKEDRMAILWEDGAKRCLVFRAQHGK